MAKEAVANRSNIKMGAFLRALIKVLSLLLTVSK